MCLHTVSLWRRAFWHWACYVTNCICKLDEGQPVSTKVPTRGHPNIARPIPERNNLRHWTAPDAADPTATKIMISVEIAQAVYGSDSKAVATISCLAIAKSRGSSQIRRTYPNRNWDYWMAMWFLGALVATVVLLTGSVQATDLRKFRMDDSSLQLPYFLVSLDF